MVFETEFFSVEQRGTIRAHCCPIAHLPRPIHPTLHCEGEIFARNAARRFESVPPKTHDLQFLLGGNFGFIGGERQTNQPTATPARTPYRKWIPVIVICLAVQQKDGASGKRVGVGHGYTWNVNAELRV